MPPLFFSFYGVADFTPVSFDTSETAEYDFRVEPVQDGKFPTVRRFRLWYRDLGVATFTANVSGFYEDGTYDNVNCTYNGADPIVIGSVGADGKMKQVYLDMTKTLMCPQLKITRAAASGPLAIIRITGIGDLKELDTI